MHRMNCCKEGKKERKKGREVKKKKKHKDGEVRSDHRKSEKGEKEKIVVVREIAKRVTLQDIALLYSLSLSLSPFLLSSSSAFVLCSPQFYLLSCMVTGQPPMPQ